MRIQKFSLALAVIAVLSVAVAPEFVGAVAGNAPVAEAAAAKKPCKAGMVKKMVTFRGKPTSKCVLDKTKKKALTCKAPGVALPAGTKLKNGKLSKKPACYVKTVKKAPKKCSVNRKLVGGKCVKK
jgi:hypothetical protein